jgi:hypothetical protein
VRLEGSLDAFSLPDIFALLSMTKKTGGLHLRRDAAHGVVWFESGLLTGGSAAIERQSLLRRVVALTGVGPDELQAASNLAEAEGIGLVAALLRAEAVAEEQVRSIAEEHVVDTVFSLLRWDNGDFEFVVDEPDRDPVGVQRAADEVVTEARRRLDEWAGLQGSVPAPDTVLRFASAPPGSVTLEPDQWSLLVLADGRRTLADIVDLSGRGEYAAVRSLAELLHAGVLCESGAGDSVVADRLAVLARIEGIPAPRQANDEPLAGASAEVVEAGEQPAPAGAGDEDAAAEADGAGEADAAVAEEPAVDEPKPLRPAGRDLSRVTPQRPEPFLPGRAPEHPDGTAMPSTVGALAAATAPAPAGHIERDPSVNKSLLLRLIAGVRGL